MPLAIDYVDYRIKKGHFETECPNFIDFLVFGSIAVVG